MDEKPSPVDILSSLENDLNSTMSDWLSFEFPYYVPILKDDKSLKIMVGRIWVKEKPYYTMTAYPSLKATKRSFLWSSTTVGKENVVFTKIDSLAEAYFFWHNALKKFFEAVPELTVENAHELLIIFNHQDGKTFPVPICVFCYVLNLQKACKANGIILTKTESQPENKESEEEGGVNPDADSEFTPDTLNIEP